MEEQRYEDLRLQALLTQGIDIDREKKKNQVLFDDPAKYAKMSDEQKKQKTEEMKKNLNNLFTEAGLGNATGS